jgi:hypothetical protein
MDRAEVWLFAEAGICELECRERMKGTNQFLTAQNGNPPGIGPLGSSPLMIRMGLRHGTMSAVTIAE